MLKDSNNIFFEGININIKYIIFLNSLFFIWLILYEFAYYLLPQIQHAISDYRSVIWYLFWATVILFVVKYKLKSTAFIGLKQADLRRNTKFAVSLILFVYFIKFGIIFASRRFDLLFTSNTKTLYVDNSFLVNVVHIIVTISIGPIIEEIIYRGFFYPPLRKRFGKLPAIIMCSAVFAAWHAGVGNVKLIINIFLLGVLFTYLYERSMSLIPSIMAHIIVNVSMFPPLLLSVFNVTANYALLTIFLSMIYLILAISFYSAYVRNRIG